MYSNVNDDVEGDVNGDLVMMFTGHGDRLIGNGLEVVDLRVTWVVTPYKWFIGSSDNGLGPSDVVMKYTSQGGRLNGDGLKALGPWVTWMATSYKWFTSPSETVFGHVCEVPQLQ